MKKVCILLIPVTYVLLTFSVLFVKEHLYEPIKENLCLSQSWGDCGW
jgi:hypothetical protein